MTFDQFAKNFQLTEEEYWECLLQLCIWKITQRSWEARER